ncbi:MAG: hypothetical protein K8W52_38850 [Deltaproteobacteria bacterium]|nr:hypothetical protein [Deltaproteobacteria bacterium]
MNAPAIAVIIAGLGASCTPPHPAPIANAVAGPDAIVVEEATGAAPLRECPRRGAPAPELEAPLRRFMANEHPVTDASIAIDARTIAGQITVTHASFEQTYCTRVVPGRPRTVLVSPSMTIILKALD